MDSVTLENFRCFREKQTARLAPLTLLVGENSTGKTSFLALVRALSDFAFARAEPDFKKEPYDLGSFDEIAHHRGGSAGRASEFMAGFARSAANNRAEEFTLTCRKRGPAPVPVRWKVSYGPVWIEFDGGDAPPLQVRFGTSKGSWKGTTDAVLSADPSSLLPFWRLFQIVAENDEDNWMPIASSGLPTEDDISKAGDLLRNIADGSRVRPLHEKGGSFASAPVRPRPRRTYDPARPAPDPEGAYIPMLYADLHFRKSAEWKELKTNLESFGKAAGLFDEIVVKPLGKRGTEPFQLQVRKFGARIKGPRRNLIDVGYGVSQALPLITELLRSGRQTTHLLQQPEVHLHPSAQAALGSFFCQIAGPRRRQLIVETHSDYLLDRVRMDIRDGKGRLKPEDVSILYFERQDLDVRIHSLRLDKEGNVREAPPSYGRFFMQEVSRSVRGRLRKLEN